jgi:GTP-binding protein
MVPADSADIGKEYEVLVNELKQYSPELMHKERLLAITKCDLLDEELMAALKKELPKKVDGVMISSVTGLGLDALKTPSGKAPLSDGRAPCRFDRQLFLAINGWHSPCARMP